MSWVIYETCRMRDTSGGQQAGRVCTVFIYYLLDC